MKISYCEDLKAGRDGLPRRRLRLGVALRIHTSDEREQSEVEITEEQARSAVYMNEIRFARGGPVACFQGDDGFVYMQRVPPMGMERARLARLVGLEISTKQRSRRSFAAKASQKRGRKVKIPRHEHVPGQEAPRRDDDWLL